MGYYLANDSVCGRKCTSAFFPVTPKTHTPVSRLKERGRRYYSAGLGRWMSRDPLGEEAFRHLYSRGKSSKERARLKLEGLSPSYIYVDDNPISHIDRMGLAGFTEACCMIGVTGNPYSLVNIKIIADTAIADANAAYHTTGEQNAYRHCIGSCFLTKFYGPLAAAGIEECHEEYPPTPQPPEDTVIDG